MLCHILGQLTNKWTHLKIINLYSNIMILLNMIMGIIWKDIKIMWHPNVQKQFLKELPDGLLASEYQEIK